MYRVNIDKLIEMTPDEQNAYQQLCNQVLTKGRNIQSIAIIGKSGISFKLSEFISRTLNKVLFIDADFTTSVFLNRYKLGKNLKGIRNYLTGSEQSDKLICMTNKEGLNIIFTGENENNELNELNYTDLKHLLDTYKNDYNNIIIEVGNDINIAKLCDTSILVMDNDLYSSEKAKEEVEKLAEQGCAVMGVVLNNI